jgi:hypothetical protein
MGVFQWTWRAANRLPRTQTCNLFSAIDEQVREKWKKVVYYVYFVPKSPYNSLRSLHAVSAYLSRIVPELFPDMHRYEARKGDP